jgi:hypothetical protein
LTTGASLTVFAGRGGSFSVILDAVGRLKMRLRILAPGARVSERTHLLPAESVKRIDAGRAAVEQTLATLRVNDQCVLKGQRLPPDQDESGVSALATDTQPRSEPQREAHRFGRVLRKYS